MNYNSLRDQIQSYANRSDKAFIDAIPSFISMGQERIWREAKDLGFEQRMYDDNLTMGSALALKPSDWNKTISFIVGDVSDFANNYTPLYQRTYEFCRAYWPNSNKTDINSVPLFYSDYPTSKIGSSYTHFFISPTPVKFYKFELTYIARVQPITPPPKLQDGNWGIGGITTNLLTNRFQDLLFYACFLEALSYLKDDERIQIYEANYARALQSVNNFNTERYSDRTSKRDV